ncbi:MAG: DUF2284 domain-containing protein [Oscillospiraceae bacterium]|nr:DUF2284 domain-containing protein [Oscillospiraceae bacterium]
MNRERLEEKLRELPLYQYAFFPTEALCFTDKVRTVCREECPMYNKSWACPPAVGEVSACREKCLRYPDCLMISTITEVSDIANLDETLATRAGHEEMTRQVLSLLREETEDTFVLSTEACAICETCAWPDGPCRHPDKMFPCVESHGILVTALSERCGIDFIAGGNVVTWYSLLFYR